MLEVNNIAKSYGKKEIVKDISFTVDKGEILAIIGPSGAGKSTILRCLNRLETVNNGFIKFNGQDIAKEKNLNFIRTKIGFLFQQFNLFPHLTALENIILAPTTLKMMTKEEALKKATKLLESVKMLDKKDSYINELSGGEQQRIAIVRTLIMNPEIIIFDEPTSSLDPETIDDITALIKKISANQVGIILVSHEMKLINTLATKILFLDKGKMVFYGTIEELDKNDNERVKEFMLNNKK